MAFATKYKIEFSDYLLAKWEIDIQEDPWAGAITTMVSSGNPCNVNYYGEDDLLERPILGSKASFEVISMTNFAYEELFTSDRFKYKVLIYKGASLFWSGFILTNNFSEPYNCPPYPVTLTAIDGLGLLSDFKFIDLAYTSRETAAKMIFDILALVEIDGFTEFVNLYESTMNDTVDDSPFDQCKIDPDLYKENDCYEALESILKSFGAGIRQDYDGKIKIFRFKELTHSTMYGRVFTDATTKSSITKVPGKYINRTILTSTYRDIEGGNKMTIPPVKTLYIAQDYKFKGSFFKNHNFPISEFVLNGGTAAYECNGWSLSAGTLTNYLSFQSVGEGDNGVIINTPADPIPPDNYIYQSVDIIDSTYVVAMKFEVSGITFDYTETSGRIYMKLINDDGGANTEYFDGEDWVVADSFINNNALPAIKVDTYGPSLKFTKVSFSVTGIPYAGTLEIRLYAGSSAGSNVYAVAKALQVFSVDTNGIIIEGIGYTVSNVINGQVIEKEFNLGDGYGFENDHLQYAGSLTVSDVPSSKSWHTMIAGVDQTEDVPLIELIGGEIGAQYIRTKQFMDIPVLETNASNILSPIGILIDILNSSPVNVLTGWTNNTFDTFTTSVTEITSAIDAGAGDAYADDTLSLTDGDLVWVECELDLISGELPLVQLLAAGAGSSPFEYLVQGKNQIIFAAPDTDDYTIRIGGVPGGTNFTLLNVSIRLSARKFGISRGTYNIKSRRWDLSLTELL